MTTLKIQAKRKNWGGDTPINVSAAKPRHVSAVDVGRDKFCLKRGGRQLVIVHEGPEQSIARWMDSGDEQCVSNSWLIPVKGGKK